ncbi:MAG: hypothetical protein QME63_00940 [Actinomycetota bacterium]|nr:hypothetical protein [Actinomycetota bacterium]
MSKLKGLKRGRLGILLICFGLMIALFVTAHTVSATSPSITYQRLTASIEYFGGLEGYIAAVKEKEARGEALTYPDAAALAKKLYPKQFAGTAPAPAPKPSAKGTGTVYVAGMGGHLAKVKVKINSADPDNPIQVLELDRTVIGPPSTNATHDARIDHKTGILYSSPYVKDTDGKAHMAAVDMKTNEVIKRSVVPISNRMTAGPIFCGSGQSAKYFMPVFMGYEGYISLIDKNTLEQKAMVHFDNPEFSKDYTWAHGINSPDMKEFFVIVSAAAPGKAGTGIARGATDLVGYVLDMADLEQGKVTVKRKANIPAGSGSVAFRPSYTLDGKKILVSARDRVFVLDASTLQVLKETMIPTAKGVVVECHDIIPTDDGKHALLALRYPAKVEGGKATSLDGVIQLYNIETGKILGWGTSVCAACHREMGLDKNSVLCGMDAVWGN